MTGAQLLDQLLELTPPPPTDASDIDQLLASATAMLEARRVLLASATELLLGTIDSARLSELAARDSAWRTAITAAQVSVGTHRANTTKLRRYAR